MDTGGPWGLLACYKLRELSPISKPQIKVLARHTPAGSWEDIVTTSEPSYWFLGCDTWLQVGFYLCADGIDLSVCTPTRVSFPFYMRTSVVLGLCPGLQTASSLVTFPIRSFSKVRGLLPMNKEGVERHSIHNAIFWIFSAIQWFPTILCWTLCFTSLETYLKAKLAIFLNP